MKTNNPKPLSPANLWLQLENTISMRSAQDQVLWSIFGAFWTANSVLLVALFTSGDFPEKGVAVVVSVVGLLLSVVWHLIQQRALLHIKRFEKLMSKIERELELDPDFAVSGEVNERDYKEILGKNGTPARTLMKVCSSVAVIAWLAALIGSLAS